MRLRHIFTSTIFHVAIVVMLTLGVSLADKAPPPPPAPKSITVELADISDITQTPDPSPAPPRPKAPEVKKPKPDSPKKPDKPDKPRPAPTNTSNVPVAPSMVDTPPKEELDEPPPPPKPRPSIKRPDKPPEPQKEPEPEEDTNKKQPPPQQRDFGSVLKNLQEVDPEQVAENDDAAGEEDIASGMDAPLGETMTISEMDALSAQLGRCWNMPIGARDIDNMVIEVQLLVNADKTVRDARIVDQARYGSDSFFQAAADTAVRAVFSPACTPLNLPEDKYTLWRNMIVEFDPRKMF